LNRVTRFAKDADAAIWRARWWILAAAILCAADQVIRMCAFHIGLLRSVKLWMFYCAATVTPVFVLGRYSRAVAPVFFCFWLLIESLQLWVLLNFNMVLGGNWILMVFSTSAAEVAEFVSGFMTFGTITFVVLTMAAAFALAFFLGSARRTWPSLSLASVSLAALCVAFLFFMAPRIFRAPVSWAQISRDLQALSLLADTFPNWQAYRNLARACRNGPELALSVTGGPRLCVFIIGESTTRNHMGLYGYWRNTTPGLDALRAEGGLTVFTDLTTTHPSTPEALCSLLTGGDLSPANDFSVIFPALLKKAGYKTALVSCQGQWQNRDVVGSYLFHSCESRRFLQGNRVAGILPDEVVLPEVEKALRENAAPFALFVHLYGCHNPPGRRVPPGFVREWPPDPAALPEKARRKIDIYDTAVAYDDHVVSSIMRMVARQGGPACVFFVSDHGESPASKIWRDVKSRDTFEVPLCIWLSPEYRDRFPDVAARLSSAKDKPLKMDGLLECLMELAGVRREGGPSREK